MIEQREKIELEKCSSGRFVLSAKHELWEGAGTSYGIY